MPPQSTAAIAQPQTPADNTTNTDNAANTADTESNLYFFDYRQARETALQRHQITTTHPSITALQVCFYDGPPQEDALDNMVNLPFEKIETRLIDLPHQLPSQIIFPVGTPENFVNEISKVIEQSLTQVVKQRGLLTNKIKQEVKHQRPIFDKNEPLRILLKTSRLTTVMQHCSRQLAGALKKLGHEVLLDVEKNDMQLFDGYLHIKAHQAFNPHVIFNINTQDTQHLHPDVFYFSWWQDPMPVLTKGSPLLWRPRDTTFSLIRDFDHYLTHCACPNIQRQNFCIDDDVFNTKYHVERENKIVFIGSSYRSRLTHSPAEKGALKNIIEHMEAGEPVDETFLRPLCQRWSISYHQIYWDLFHYAARDITLQWLCRDSDIPVEVYGRGWEGDPIVRPFFRGELPHGAAVARVYNAARFALISHPFEVNSQRLVEAAACGSAPVVFDCRHMAERPHWDEYCCFFSTAQQLQQCLNTNADGDPTPLAKTFTYENLALRVTKTVHDQLKWT
ncbi:MAG: hypothetical protein GXP17_01940 [Gammaproteobacteria bacterium]|nr:hypothetical protein [Gammaproteobacteria bacterium]